MTISIPTGTLIDISSMYTSKSYKAGVVVHETKCYITVEFKEFYSNGNTKEVKLFKRDDMAMFDWESEYFYKVR